MLYEITKTLRRVIVADSIDEAVRADARDEIIWSDEDITSVAVRRVHYDEYDND